MNEVQNATGANGQESVSGFDGVVYLKARMHAESDAHRAILRKRSASMSTEEREAFQARFDKAALKISAQFGQSTRYISPKDTSK